MVELSNGCVCCSASDEMLKGIDWLIQRNGDAEPFDHIVVLEQLLHMYHTLSYFRWFVFT